MVYATGLVRGWCLDEDGRREEALEAYRAVQARAGDSMGAAAVAGSMGDVLERPFHWDHP